MDLDQYRFVFLPGLGFTGAIFQQFETGSAEVVYPSWIVPEKRESLSHYARRMVGSLPETRKKNVLVGYSFGGMLALEMGAFMTVDRTFIISSIKSKQEVPLKFRLLSRFGIHRLISRRLILWSFPFWSSDFGFHEDEAKKLFVEMVRTQNDRYLRWALNQIGIYIGPQSNMPFIQIHGAEDRTFPIQKIDRPDIIIPAGDHMMVYYRSSEVWNKILSNLK